MYVCMCVVRIFPKIVSEVILVRNLSISIACHSMNIYEYGFNKTTTTAANECPKMFALIV